RGHYTEGYERASQALDRSATTGPDRIAAVRGAGVLANFKGDPGLAGSLFEQGLALADEIGDVSGKAAFLSSIGNLETQFGNIAAAVERFSEALRIYEVLGDRSGMARVLNNLALAEQWLGELESARGHYRQCLDMNRQSGDTTMIALSHHNLGWIAFEFNELDDAVEEYEASLAMRRELGERGGVADTLTNLGDVRLVEKRFDDAEALYAEARAIYGEIADVRGVALTEFGLSAVAGARGDDAVERRLLEGAAAVLHGLGEQRSLGAVLGSLAFNHARSGRVDDAVRAFGAIEAHRVASGYHVPREVREQHEVQAAVLAGMVGNTERFSAFFAEGQGMSLSDVVSTFVSLVERGS
ncbi:MAG: tetratricopeptide repeat protein, partial [Fimbriimonadaceae bacterium]